MDWYLMGYMLAAIAFVIVVMCRHLLEHRRLDDRMKAIVSRVGDVESALSPFHTIEDFATGRHTVYRQTATREHVQEVEKQTNATGELVKKLTARIAVLECAAKGHVHRRTCTGDAARIATPGGEWYWFQDRNTDFAGDGVEHGTRTTVTCLDCGTVLSDDWKPKEVEDESSSVEA